MATLAVFTNGIGNQPRAGLTLGNDGALYGTTYAGGLNNDGTLFRVSTNGDLTTLLSFGGTNGANPAGDLALGGDGLLYGTTQSGGWDNYGTVFACATNGVLTSLGAFYDANGSGPQAGLLLGADGNFYGTTWSGGTYECGTVFQCSTNGTPTTLATFSGTNGARPESLLALGPDGSFYGTTYGNGGLDASGTIFKVSTNGALSRSVSFTRTNGQYPYAGLTLAGDGNLYGTTYSGGSAGAGVVFRLNTAAQPPVLLPVSVTNGMVSLGWSASIGRLYQVQYQMDLTSSAWNNLGLPLAATNRVVQVSDTVGANGRRFYRVVLLPL